MSKLSPSLLLIVIIIIQLLFHFFLHITTFIIIVITDLRVIIGIINKLPLRNN